MNKSETALLNIFRQRGWNTFRNGFPDIMAEHNNILIGIEVKTGGGENLKPNQEAMAALLARHGIKTYRWDPHNGFKCRISKSQGISAMVKEMVRIQNITGYMDEQFAKCIGVSRVWWNGLKKGKVKLTPAVKEAAVRAFPALRKVFIEELTR